ncbi:coiled-coil domain-containing protein 12 [Cajanus cajan]|uniref:Coiled-coil domain-containing protein 12 n=1 Tax=Cajanus cajan TaxID=3821 RepID=A0A151RKQ2_CAJCA|nr:coiled-coil domain-containing protein 12 [Cajanus cajan]KYP43073.1 Coiled-coil domain-containing protein 12 [Cajanus cajan]
MGSEEDSIEQSVASRRERLLALRAAQELSSAPEPDSEPEPKQNDDEEDQQLEMKFRNYVPHDKHLQEGKLAPAVLPKFEDASEAVPPPEPEAKEDPFLNIAPKKPNWDLRRDVQKKLDKLEKRTQKALYQLMVEQEKQKQLAEGDDTNGTAE